jgi:dTMP kinase
MPRGRFISFEGSDGAGKSTQTKRLAAALRAGGRTVVETREPGGSPAAERVRAALLGLPESDGQWTPDAECLLHYAARRQHVCDVIEPALKRGDWVISDRFSDSTMAYQGIAGGVGADRVRALHAWALGDFLPDLTIVLTLSVAAGIERVHDRARGQAPDVYERRPTAFHAAVAAAFLEIVAAAPERCVAIDASGPSDAVAAAVAATVAARLGPA